MGSRPQGTWICLEILIAEKVVRTLEQALVNAGRLRAELPHLIQPSSTDRDMVILADRIYELEAALWLLDDYMDEAPTVRAIIRKALKL